MNFSLDEIQQALDGFFLGDVTFDTFLAPVERDAAAGCATAPASSGGGATSGLCTSGVSVPRGSVFRSIAAAKRAAASGTGSGARPSDDTSCTFTGGFPPSS